MLPSDIHTFWNYREDLSMENGLVTKGARLVIPSTLRSKVLEQIHNMDTSRIHKELLRRQPTATSQEPQNWSLDNQFLSRKCMEMFGEQPLSINQLLNQIPTGSGFQTTPS